MFRASAMGITSTVGNDIVNPVLCGIYDFKKIAVVKFSVCCLYLQNPGISLETEGSVLKIQKRALFHNKKVKKVLPNFTSPYVRSLFTIILIKQT